LSAVPVRACLRRARPPARTWRAFAAATLLAGLATAVQAVDIDVVGLFAGKAVVRIDNGAPRTLAVGQATPEGVRLLRADSSEAEFEVAGKRQVLGLGRGRFGGAGAADNPSVTLYADGRGHFVSDGAINGVAVRFLVDTGATSVAMSGRDAARIGLDYRSGQRQVVSTANGIVEVRGVKLDRVQIGGITLTNVEAVVHDGDSPSIVLIGMSVLNRLEMKRDGGLMTLIKRY
jgi:aspartyl protease family protein